MVKQDYSFFERLLHRCALQWPAIAEISFDIENAFVNKKGIFRDDHVFISGLARSGTTMLTQYLYETGQFRSLTYRDMPFVLMPNTWKKLSSIKRLQKIKERAHADGIMIGPDSPEEFDEVFWRVFCGKDYIKKDRLLALEIDDEVLKKFSDYIKNVLASGTGGQNRYLSKNNNNILRVNYLQKHFPNSHIIIPFREPSAHAASLLNQHLHFFDIQSHDEFSLDYMNWLGHFEFGLNQKPLYLGNDYIFAQMQDADKYDISYWLLSWKNYYGYVLNQPLQNILFLSFEDFCKSPKETLDRLFGKLNIELPVKEYQSFQPPVRTDFDVKSDLLAECDGIYDQLVAKAI